MIAQLSWTWEIVVRPAPSLLVGISRQALRKKVAKMSLPTIGSC